MKLRVFFLSLLLFWTFTTPCSAATDVMQDGYYSAVAAEFNVDGWKDFITIYVYKNQIVTVEWNARNASGFIRSWDTPYLRRMQEYMGEHPNHFIRKYGQELVLAQVPGKVQRLRGDEYFYEIFKLLAKTATANAMRGDRTVTDVALPEATMSFRQPSFHKSR